MNIYNDNESNLCLREVSTQKAKIHWCKNRQGWVHPYYSAKPTKRRKVAESWLLDVAARHRRAEHGTKKRLDRNEFSVDYKRGRYFANRNVDK